MVISYPHCINEIIFLGSNFGSWFKKTFHLGSEKRVKSNVEPKVFLANERTFLAWLDMAVTLASVSVAVLAYVFYVESLLIFCRVSKSSKWAKIVGAILVPISIGFSVYALRLYMNVSGYFIIFV